MGTKSAIFRLGVKGLGVVGLALLLAACETTTTQKPVTTGGNYKIGQPYKIGGVWYYPKEQPNYNETGLASWYGDKFHGKPTANGEIYDQHQMTAAHKTLPMPTKVRVTNLENGKQIEVRVNDRGPFVKGRIIDLSSKAAELLDIKQKGTAMVRVEYLGRLDNETFYSAKPKTPESQKKVKSAPVSTVSSDDLSPIPGGQVAAAETPKPTTKPVSEGVVKTVPVPASPGMYIHAASFLYKDNAVRLRGQLIAEGHSASQVQIAPAMVNGNQFYRVRIGPLSSVAAADQALDRVVKAGHKGARIVVD